MKPNDEQFDVIINNSDKYDNIFYYGLTSTRIFCKPSCKSRIPNRDNVLIFTDPKDALDIGFRPCKRCKPLSKHSNEFEIVEVVKDYIKQNYHKKITLQDMANQVYLSQYHMHRIFKKMSHETPLDFLNNVRISKAKRLLKTTNLTNEKIAQKVGFKKAPQFVNFFKKHTDFSPMKYRKKYNKE